MMCKIVQAHREKEKHGQNTHQELKNYLENPLEEVVDRVKWWGVSIKYTSYLIILMFSSITPLNIQSCQE